MAKKSLNTFKPDKNEEVNRRNERFLEIIFAFKKREIRRFWRNSPLLKNAGDEPII